MGAVVAYPQEEGLVFFLQQSLAGPGSYFPISHLIIVYVKGAPVKRLPLGLPGCAVARHAVEGEDYSLAPGLDDVARVGASLARKFLFGIADLAFSQRAPALLSGEVFLKEAGAAFVEQLSCAES